MDNRPIGVMDSGIGGLTVAKALKAAYPQEGIVFLGDTKRNPYGERTKEEIVDFSFAIKDFLLKKQVKMILIACNTISFNVPESFFAGDVPVVKMSMDVKVPADAKRFAVFATPATIKTHAHKAYFAEKYPQLDFVEVPCDGLAAAIEQGADEETITAILEKAVKDYGAGNIDTAIWSCTHYPLIADIFQKVLPSVRFLDPALPTVETGMEILRKKDALAGDEVEKDFYFTEGLENSRPLVQGIFGDVKVERVDF